MGNQPSPPRPPLLSPVILMTSTAGLPDSDPAPLLKSTDLTLGTVIRGSESAGCVCQEGELSSSPDCDADRQKVLVIRKRIPTELESSLLRELTVISSLNHPCLCKCLGYLLPEDDYDSTHFWATVVFEWCEEGFLAPWLSQKETEFEISPRGKVKILLQVARGLKKLADLGIVHGDVGIRNVLVGRVTLEGLETESDSSGTVIKLIKSEFGESSFSPPVAAVTATDPSQLLLTPLSPSFDLFTRMRRGRVLDADAPYLDKLEEEDVLEFGILAWRVWVGEKAWAEYHHASSASESESEEFRPRFPHELFPLKRCVGMPSVLKSLVAMSWRDKAADRVHINGVLDVISELVREMSGMVVTGKYPPEFEIEANNLRKSLNRFVAISEKLESYISTVRNFGSSPGDEEAFSQDIQYRERIGDYLAAMEALLESLRRSVAEEECRGSIHLLRLANLQRLTEQCELVGRGIVELETERLSILRRDVVKKLQEEETETDGEGEDEISEAMIEAAMNNPMKTFRGRDDAEEVYCRMLVEAAEKFFRTVSRTD